MCYNCGCGMPNNDMGKPENITERRLAEASYAEEMTLSDSRKNVLELLQKVLAAKEIRPEKEWKP